MHGRHAWICSSRKAQKVRWEGASAKCGYRVTASPVHRAHILVVHFMLVCASFQRPRPRPWR